MLVANPFAQDFKLLGASGKYRFRNDAPIHELCKIYRSTGRINQNSFRRTGLLTDALYAKIPIVGPLQQEHIQVAAGHRWMRQQLPQSKRSCIRYPVSGGAISCEPLVLGEARLPDCVWQRRDDGGRELNIA